MEKLFLFEILIETLNFKSVPTPYRDDLVIYISVGDIFFLRSVYNSFSQLEVDREPVTNTIEYNTGKSYIFTYSVEKFRKILKETPLLLHIYEEDSAVGVATLPWHDAFVSMLEENITYSNVNSPPVCYSDDFDIMRGSKKIGSTFVFVRLTCFGKSVTTIFQVAEIPNALQARQFFFKGMERDIIFQTQRYGLGASSEIIPVAPLFNSPHGIGDEDSFETILNESKTSQFSYFKGTKKSVGGVDRYNIQNLTIKDFRKCLCKNPDCPGNASFRDFGLDILKQNKPKRITRSPDDDIPIDHGLTHVSGTIEGYGPSSSYRRPKQLQQPFIPKDAKKDKCLRGGSPLRLKGGGNEDIDEKSECKKREPFNFEQLASFGLEDPASACKSLLNDFDKCLEAFKDTIGPCKMATCSYAPNVFQNSCKCPTSIRNRNLNSSKSQESLGFEVEESTCKRKDGESADQGPSAKVSDPEFSVPKVSTSRESQCDPCKIIQECNAPTPDNSEENALNINVYIEKVSACGIPNCPHSRVLSNNVDKNFKLQQLKPACGSTNCPFAKKILGTANEDDMVYLQFLSLKPDATCGKYHSPYKVPKEVPLPPIHWDCPEPLPEGNCRNPDCPFLPEILRKLKPKSIIDEILKSDIKESCGNPCCPYCCYPPTPPCGNPACPCCVSPPICSSPPPSPCKQPSIPYQPPPPANRKGKPCNCNKAQSAELQPSSPTPCGNPLCPNNQPENSKITCPNTECPNKPDNDSLELEPLPPKVFEDETPCHLRQNTSGEYDPCRNPNCRFAKVDSVCINPKCVYNKTAIENTWCGDNACYLDNKYFEKEEEDFCKQFICPRISFTGFLYK